jgi:hypothetical protein
MQDLHWRYNFDQSRFDFIENNPQQHYEPLLRDVHVPTLVIDIGLVSYQDLGRYVRDVLDSADAAQLRFQQLIFDATQDPMVNRNEKTQVLDSLVGELGIPSYLAISQWQTSTHTYLKELHYPSWLFAFKKQDLPQWDFDRTRQHAFSCLNRNPTFHRLVLYTMIKERGLLDHFVYSFYDRCPYQGHQIRAWQYADLDRYVGSELAERCRTSISDFPISWQGEELGKNDHSLNHAAYRDTWCNLVTETSVLEPFTSEKIWKPIAAGQMFLIVGAPGTCQWLQTLGFQVPDCEYDLETDLVTRLSCILDVVDRYRDDAQGWWKRNRFSIEHNYHWFHSGNVEKNLLRPLQQQLNHKY